MMEVLSKETLELLQATAVKASNAAGKLAIVKPDAEPDYVYYTVDPDGKIERRLAEARPRAHELGALDEVVSFCEERGGPSTVVWYSAEGVVIVLDDTTRRDVARLEFQFTPQFETVRQLDENRPAYAQREFRKLLRIELAGCLESPRLLNWVSDVKASTTATGGGNLRNERESLGREVDAQVISGAGDMPEQVPLSVRLFDDAALQERQGIMCLFDFSIQDLQFRLIPLPLEVHSAIEREVSYIGEKLADQLKPLEIPLFRGQP